MTKYEQYLREVLAELMDVDAQQLSLTATVFDQGMDSLVGLRLARKVQDFVGAEIELEWIYDYPTLQQLAGFLEERFGSR